MKPSILFAFGVLLFLPLYSYGEEHAWEPPADPVPLDVSFLQYLTLQINGGDEPVMVCGKTCKITGEIELTEGTARLDYVMVKLFVHHERARGGAIIVEALAELTLIEGSRYSFTSDLTPPLSKTGGEVELRVITGDPGKDRQVGIYCETVTLLPPPEFWNE